METQRRSRRTRKFMHLGSESPEPQTALKSYRRNVHTSQRGNGTLTRSYSLIGGQCSV